MSNLVGEDVEVLAGVDCDHGGSSEGLDQVVDVSLTKSV